MDSTKIWEKHISVLLNELVDWITIFQDKQNIVVDATLWMWWHAEKIINSMNSGDIFIWFDADIKNLELAKKRLENIKSIGVKLIFINSNFSNLKDSLEKVWITKITWIYYDLWLSSLHVDEADRWFSFRLDGPLDMRFDKTCWKTAADIVNSYSQSDLRSIFIKYWEEPTSTKIAAKIVERRKENKVNSEGRENTLGWKFKTTHDLSNLIWEVSKSAKSKNRIFQAIRIETNKELESLEKTLKEALNLLEKAGRIFVISFHSLEDRITKQIFKKETRDCICSDIICSCMHKKSLKILTKKPIIPTKEEIKDNPRSRSAKARLAEKI